MKRYSFCLFAILFLFLLGSCSKTFEFTDAEKDLIVYQEGDKALFLTEMGDTLDFQVTTSNISIINANFIGKNKAEFYRFSFTMTDSISGSFNMSKEIQSKDRLDFRFGISVEDKPWTVGDNNFNIQTYPRESPKEVNGVVYQNLLKFESTNSYYSHTDQVKIDELIILWYSTEVGIVKIENETTGQFFSLLP